MLTFYFCLYQPDLVKKLIIKVDVFYFSELAEQEHERIEKIRALTIPYEQKLVLMNRTVFLQASQEMIKLALGEPQSAIPDPPPTTGHATLVYYLGEDKRPTLFEFEDDKLLSAHKGSSLDINQQSNVSSSGGR